MKIQKPLLAGKFDSEKAKFPYAATPKIDGIRFLMVGGAALTRSFKPIRNEYLQKILSSNLPDGIEDQLFKNVVPLCVLKVNLILRFGYSTL